MDEPTGSSTPPHGSPEEPPGVPRWVRLMGVALAVLVVVAVLAMLLLGGDHGPGRHLG